MNVTFSIVIATYNNLNQLERAIESVLAQTIPCEVILIDDGSNDGTEAYGRRLGQCAIYYRHRVRLGYGESLNVGVELAQGNWIKFLNDSARLEPTCLEQMKQAIEQFPQAVLVSCSGSEISPDKLDGTPPSCKDSVVCISQEDIHYQMLVNHLYFGSPAQVAVRRDAFLRAGGWSSPSSSSYAAIDSWTRITRYGDAIEIDRPLSKTRFDLDVSSDEDFDETQLEAQLAFDRHLYENLPQRYRSQLLKNPELQQYWKLNWSLMGLQKNIKLKSNRLPDTFSGSIVGIWSRLTQILSNKMKRSVFHQEPHRKPSQVLEPMERSQ